MPKKLRVAAMLSGGGTTLQNIIDLAQRDELPITVDIVISSKEDAYGLERARKYGIETAVIPSRNFRKHGKPDWQAMSEAIDAVLLPCKPELVCLCGFMCFYRIPQALENRVINIHPSLIPSFCGHGMCGHHVHEAVAASGVKISGCTVHFVNNEYDAGPIIVQHSCPVYDTDSPDEIAARVFEQECVAYPEAIRLFAAGRLRVEKGIVKILPGSENS